MSNALRNTLIFSFATMISRVSGLFRDALFADYFGTSSQYDAYLVAILIPFFLRKIFAEGAMQMAFVPMFNEKMHESKEKAFRFASTIILVMLGITMIFSTSGIVFSRPLTGLLAGGLEPDAVELTSKLMKISFPFVTLVSLWAIYYSILNSMNAFFLAALSPAFINISTIVGIFLSKRLDPPILGPTIGFLAGGVVQLLSLMIASRWKGFRFKPSYNNDDVKAFMTLFLTSAIAPAINQVNSLVDTKVATELGVGAVASIQYAMRLYQLPLGMFGVAVATVALPELSKLSVSGNKDEFKRVIWKSINTLAYFLIPATIGLIILGKGIVALLFEHGLFTPEDTIRTTKILYAYTLGIPFYGAYGVLSRAYYARKKPRIPAVTTTVMVILNIILDIALGFSMGPVGVALATSISGMFGTARLMLPLIISAGYEKNTLGVFAKILLATAAMTVSLILFVFLLGTGSIATVLQIAIGSTVYIGLTMLLGIGEAVALKNRFFRKRGKKYRK